MAVVVFCARHSKRPFCEATRIIHIIFQSTRLKSSFQKLLIYTFSLSRPGKSVRLSRSKPKRSGTEAMRSHLMSRTMGSSDDSDWHVHSLILFFHDLHGLRLRRPSSTVPASTVFSGPSCRQIWPNHDNLQRLTVDSKTYWLSASTLTLGIIICVRLLRLL